MDKKKIIKLSKKDFEQAWKETQGLIPKPHHDEEYPRLRLTTGKPHILNETFNNLREAYLRLGFNETFNPVLIDKEDVYRQFGPEAPAVLDRCYYLAGLPRPDIGIGLDKIEKIEKLGIELDEEKIQNLKDVFRGYKKGTVDGDDLVLEVSSALQTPNESGLKVLERVFPEIHNLEALASNTTLRSHMTSGWFITLGSCHNTSTLPLKLFSIDRCFRREQKEDASHLRTYHSASCVIMDDEVSLDTGKAVSESLLEYFGFSKFKFIPDEKKSKYYIPTTQTEVYGYHPQLNEWVEIATFGLYSPIALSKYGIDKQVMNLGVGVERVAMVLNGYRDIRKMVYPLIYEEQKLTDRDLTTMLHMNYYPVTPDGRILMNKIQETWNKYKNTDSPCQYTIHDGEFLGQKIIVTAEEEETNTQLLGPAATNQIYIQNGNIMGIPIETDKPELIKVRETGTPTDIDYMSSLAAQAAYKIEEMIISGLDSTTIHSTIARSLSDINLKIDDVAMNYITSNNKTIDVRGPIFSTIKAQNKG